MAIGVVLVLGVCIAVLKFRGVQKVTAVKTPQPAQVASTSSRNDAADPRNSSAPAIDTSATQPLDVIVIDNSRRATSLSGKRKVNVAVEVRKPQIKSETTDPASPPAPSQARTSDEPSTGITDSNKKSSSDPALVKPKSKTGLSPLVVAPLKPDSTRKAKVIEWP
jgi:hypothetical protein